MSDTLTLALHIDRLMRRIHADLHPKALKVDDPKLGPLGGMILMAIDENGPISVQDLSADLARDKGQMTRYVQTLERKALIERIAWPEDRRVSHLQLTDAGRDLVAAFRSALADVMDALLVDVDTTERKQFLATLHKLSQSKADGQKAASAGGDATGVMSG
ncbi:MAG: MarR family transcriptional regulator [Pseudomonadota bacterium]